VTSMYQVPGDTSETSVSVQTVLLYMKKCHSQWYVTVSCSVHGKYLICENLLACLRGFMTQFTVDKKSNDCQG
jgi:hypothetical protein